MNFIGMPAIFQIDIEKTIMGNTEKHFFRLLRTASRHSTNLVSLSVLQINLVALLP